MMDTYNAMKRDKVQGTPATLTEFLTGIQPVDDGSAPTPQITQGDTTYSDAIKDVEQRDKTADLVTNQLGQGESRTGFEKLDNFIPFSRKPYPHHQEAMEHKDRLDTRREIGYDK